jgi:hypothetical protein
MQHRAPYRQKTSGLRTQRSVSHIVAPTSSPFPWDGPPAGLFAAISPQAYRVHMHMIHAFIDDPTSSKPRVAAPLDAKLCLHDTHIVSEAWKKVVELQRAMANVRNALGDDPLSSPFVPPPPPFSSVIIVHTIQFLFLPHPSSSLGTFSNPVFLILPEASSPLSLILSLALSYSPFLPRPSSPFPTLILSPLPSSPSLPHPSLAYSANYMLSRQPGWDLAASLSCLSPAKCRAALACATSLESDGSASSAEAIHCLICSMVGW